MKAALVRARSRTDRRITREQVIRLFDALPGAITRIFKLKAEAEVLRRDNAIEPAQLRAKLAAMDFEYRILKEMIIDRTIPVVQKITVEDAMSHLPRAEDDLVEAQATVVGDPVQEARRESAELLRRILTEGAISRPGLVLVRPPQEGDRAIG